MDYDISPIRNWCGVTHHAGCACYEKARNEEIESLRKQIEKAHHLLLVCQERLDGTGQSDILFDEINRMVGISEK